MQANAPRLPTTRWQQLPRRLQRSFAALGAVALCALALLSASEPLTADATGLTVAGTAAESDAASAMELSPSAQAPGRPARRHRQPLAMPFFSFAPRS